MNQKKSVWIWWDPVLAPKKNRLEQGHMITFFAGPRLLEDHGFFFRVSPRWDCQELFRYSAVSAVRVQEPLVVLWPRVSLAAHLPCVSLPCQPWVLHSIYHVLLELLPDLTWPASCLNEPLRHCQARASTTLSRPKFVPPTSPFLSPWYSFPFALHISSSPLAVPFKTWHSCLFNSHPNSPSPCLTLKSAPPPCDDPSSLRNPHKP